MIVCAAVVRRLLVVRVHALEQRRQHVGTGGVDVHAAAKISVRAGGHVVANLREIRRAHPVITAANRQIHHVFAVVDAAGGVMDAALNGLGHGGGAAADVFGLQQRLNGCLRRRVDIRQRRAVGMEIRFARPDRRCIQTGRNSTRRCRSNPFRSRQARRCG